MVRMVEVEENHDIHSIMIVNDEKRQWLETIP
jgi:hypothetical protein